MYLTRSKSALLSLDICTLSPMSEFIGPHQQNALFCSLIVPHLQRCRSISILEHFSHKQSIVEEIMTNLGGTHPINLEKLVIRAEFCREREGPFNTIHTHALTELRLSGPTVASLALSISPSSLTTLHLSRGRRYTESLNFPLILCECPALKTLAIYDDIISHWPHVASNDNRPFLPELTSLFIYGTVPWVSEFLLWITTPALCDLAIIPLALDDLDGLLETQDVSYHNVRKFTVVPYTQKNYGILPKAATCFPSVRHLLLPWDFSAVDVTKALVDADGVALWPALQTLSMRNLSDVKEPFLHSVVASRKEKGFPLKAIHVDADSLDKIEDLETLRTQVAVEVVDEWFRDRDNMWYDQHESLFTGHYMDDDASDVSDMPSTWIL